jgi:hypothetical protein
MFEKIKNFFGKEPVKEVVQPAAPTQPVPKKKRKPKEKVQETPKTAKELATEAGEPYIEVVNFDMDGADVHTGNFTLDFNDIFVAKLIRAGYQLKKDDTDYEIVDRWFTQICRSIVLEQYEQDQADPTNRDMTMTPFVKDLGNGRKEVS